MTSSFLRKFRIGFSVVVLLCFVFIFVDYRSLIPESYKNYLLFLQFIPSLIKFLDLKTLAAGGFIVVLLLTLLSGRTYCSFLCPLGITQDLFSRIGGRIKKRFNRFGFRKPFTIVRYTLLAATLAVAIIWGIYLVTLLDPYSIFGRSVTYFVKPVVLLLNNLFSGILGKLDNYALSHIQIKGFELVAYSIPAAFLLLVGLLSVIKGRLYCNMICPVGTLLGLVSKISVFRIKFNVSKCTRCGRCSVVCKSSCIDFLNYRVDVSRCVDCFNCISTCPDKAISYGVVSLKKNGHKTDESKRKFVVAIGSYALWIVTVCKSSGKEGPGANP